MNNEIMVAGKFKRFTSRFIGYFTDSIYTHMFLIISGIDKISRHYSILSGIASLLSGLLLLTGYIYLARKGTSISKLLFSLQVVNIQDGSNIGTFKTIFRDQAIMTMTFLYGLYFAFLAMSFAKPSTARNRIEEAIEDAERGAAAAAAVGSAVLLLKSDALFIHDKWFKTAVIQKPYSMLWNEVKPKNNAVEHQESSITTKVA